MPYVDGNQDRIGPLLPREFMPGGLSFAAHSVSLDLAPITIREFDGTIRHWTRGMQRLCGYSPDDANGRISHRLLKTEFPKALTEVETELLDRREWSGELRHVHQDGRRLVVSTQWSLGEGRLSGRPMVSEVNQDVTELKLVRSRQALLADVLENSQDAVIIKTLDGVVTDLNPAAERLYGFEAAELLGKSVFLFYPPELIAQEKAIIAKVAASVNVEHFETVRRRKDGSMIEVSLSVTPVHDDEGRIVGAAHIARDITERNAARGRVLTLQGSLAHMGRLNTMGQMASALAHELRQPLTALGNYLSAAVRISSRDDIDRARQELSLDKAREQAKLTVKVLEHLQTFMSKERTERSLTDINEIVEASVRLGTLDARKSRISVALDLDKTARPRFVDPVHIGQVVVNLVRNAVEAMAESATRRLEITTRETGNALEIIVADTGPGIPEEVRKSLFQPFVTSKATGMGLGLSISRELICAHGGELSASTRREGGTAFTVSLPSNPERLTD